MNFSAKSYAKIAYRIIESVENLIWKAMVMSDQDRIARYLDNFSEQEPEEFLPNIMLVLKTWIQAAQINALSITEGIESDPPDTKAIRASIEEVIAVNARVDDMLSAALQYVAARDKSKKKSANIDNEQPATSETS